MDELAKLYGVLELEAGATAEEIKAADLDLVKVWHPDATRTNPRAFAIRLSKS